jgi:hypothetical protein
MPLIILLLLLSSNLHLQAATSAIGECGRPGFLETQTSLLSALSNHPTSGSILSNFVLPHPENCLRIDDPSLESSWQLALEQSSDPFVLCKALAWFSRRPEPPEKPGIIVTFLSHPDAEVRAMAGLVLGSHPEAFQTGLDFTVISNSLSSSTPGIPPWIRTCQSGTKSRKSNPFTASRSPGWIVPWFKAGTPAANLPGFNQGVFISQTEPPESMTIVPPVLKYDDELVFETPRRSFGVGSDNIHLGDDCAWFRDGTPVFSITEGLVRLVWSSEEWGNLILIEHRQGTNRFCSLYGHLSDTVMVSAGDRVTAGQLIGMTGFSYSRENGGYGSHLHFAVSEGSWLRSQYRAGRHIRIEGRNGPETAAIKSVGDGRVEIGTASGPASFPLPAETLNDRLQWVKGYQTKDDSTSGWLDPYEFIKRNTK